MSIRALNVASVLVSLAFAALPGQVYAYDPPQKSADLLKNTDFSAAVAFDEPYRLEFVACDGGHAGLGSKDHFLGFNLKLPNVSDSKQYYLCSRDPSNVKALLRLVDGAILWESKMALDVDGSWAAWNGLPGATDLKETSYKWPGSTDHSAHSAQIDPDRIPFIVMPTAGLSKITGNKSGMMGRLFAEKTGLHLGDMGVVIYKDHWTPVLIGDGGPFMRLGEGSSRVFEAIGESRCKKWRRRRPELCWSRPRLSLQEFWAEPRRDLHHVPGQPQSGPHAAERHFGNVRLRQAKAGPRRRRGVPLMFSNGSRSDAVPTALERSCPRRGGRHGQRSNFRQV